MKNTIASVLIITNQNEEIYQELIDFLTRCGCEIVIEQDWGTSIHRVQDRPFDVIILDTRVKGMEIRQAIQIFKNLDPRIKIIVKTDSSSKKLEAQIRQEKIYYYHIDSFDEHDLKLAIKSAIEDRRIKHA